MLDLSRSLSDELVLEEQHYTLNLAFNRVLKVLELLHDEEVEELVKGYVALEILTDQEFSFLSVEDSFGVFQAIFDEHISLEEKTEPVLDLMGNPIKSLSRKKKVTGQKRLFSIKYDSDYIYASFLQAYGIDLFKVQDSLHWKKFYALLVGLPSGTKFAEVLKVRSYKPQKGDSNKYKEKMRELKKVYALPDDFPY